MFTKAKKVQNFLTHSSLCAKFSSTFGTDITQFLTQNYQRKKTNMSIAAPNTFEFRIGRDFDLQDISLEPVLGENVVIVAETDITTVELNISDCGEVFVTDTSILSEFQGQDNNGNIFGSCLETGCTSFTATSSISDMNEFLVNEVSFSAVDRCVIEMTSNSEGRLGMLTDSASIIMIEILDVFSIPRTVTLSSSANIDLSSEISFSVREPIAFSIDMSTDDKCGTFELLSTRSSFGDFNICDVEPCVSQTIVGATERTLNDLFSRLRFNFSSTSCEVVFFAALNGRVDLELITIVVEEVELSSGRSRREKGILSLIMLCSFFGVCVGLMSCLVCCTEREVCCMEREDEEFSYSYEQQ